MLCRSPLGKHEVALALVGYVFLVALTYAFTHVFSGRGAFTQIGALIGTIMVANVFVIIIPYQRKTVAALIAGKEPDPVWGALGKQRSMHNNYLTLPVVFLMLSNHYPLFFATQYNWLIVAIVLLIGPVIRHYFNSRHEGKGRPVVDLGGGGRRHAGDRLALRHRRRHQDGRAAARRNSPRCRRSSPHAAACATPRSRSGPASSSHRRACCSTARKRSGCTRNMIAINAVHSRAMPPGNVTEITPDERQVLAAWLAAGAPAQ